MDFAKDLWDKARSIGIWYRRYMYYYFGYLRHELRLPSSAYMESKKKDSIKENNLSEIEKHIYDGTWKVDDLVSINNMTTMLHEAVVMDRRDIAAFLLRQGADPNIRDRNGMTPLLKAAALGREFMVIELLRNGVNPEHRDPYGNTPLEKAQLHEEWKVAEILMSCRSYAKTNTKWFWPPDI
ncbi:hypothetical protein SteCoe_5686 [Stentor coeruleus]|uniref:Uncharacterized protein n=1 Tax=Stentor coeruleus TaxID=5963 RepID=A0A1R2CRQ1_9CILI|nr:hypothetical protein SteCoe_5686 [Stentor coeruleus]